MRQTLTITGHEGEGASWEMAVREPSPELAAGSFRYCGYEEHSLEPVSRLEVPHGRVVLIFSFGDAIELGGPAGESTQRSFVAGHSDQRTVTRYRGRQAGVQLDLTPLDAYRLLGVPMRVLANEVVPLDDLGVRWARGLGERLAEQPGWEARFALLDDVLGRGQGEAPPVDRAVAWAWAQLARSHGGVPVGALAEEIGWSRRHFVSRFREQVGLAPKPTAQVLRFRRAVGLLRGTGASSISDIAAACGYADHSHLDREFRRLAGCTPSSYLAAREPGRNGVAAEE
ncbi:MAG: helix-turn-helix domain-containing protein [Acidimicrobiia bacterium]|nr:helix-turn-helix domain-containing protein [Acidimicrobiia bacterium]